MAVEDCGSFNGLTASAKPSQVLWQEGGSEKNGFASGLLDAGVFTGIIQFAKNTPRHQEAEKQVVVVNKCHKNNKTDKELRPIHGFCCHVAAGVSARFKLTTLWMSVSPVIYDCACVCTVVTQTLMGWSQWQNVRVVLLATHRVEKTPNDNRKMLFPVLCSILVEWSHTFSDLSCCSTWI